MGRQKRIDAKERGGAGESGLFSLMLTDANLEMTSEPAAVRSRRKQIAEVLRHPFVLLAIGAVTTSLLVPYLNSKINRSQLLREARLNRAIEIGKRNTEFNSKFNALKTMLESFHNQNVRLVLQPSELRAAQLKFRDDFSKRYLELDETAWWWYSDLEKEASVLDLIPPNELQALDIDLEKYGDNLHRHFEVLKPLWQVLTSQDYNPNDQTSRDKVEQIIKDVNKGGPLFQDRSDLIERITRHFTSIQ